MKASGWRGPSPQKPVTTRASYAHRHAQRGVPSSLGGMGSVVFHLSGHLARLGHRVTVLARSHSQDAPLQEGVSVIEVPWFPLPMQFTRSYGRAALRALQHLHAEDPVDVIHTHLPLISLSRREHARLRAMAPVVASLHGSWLGEHDGMRLLRHREGRKYGNPNDLCDSHQCFLVRSVRTHRAVGFRPVRGELPRNRGGFPSAISPP